MSPLHIDLLLALKGATPHSPTGLSAELLLGDMRRLRHRSLTLPAVETAIRDLADRRLAALVQSPLGDRWRITALGTSTLSEEGL